MSKIKYSNKIINREISWLSFNERVLQEAADPSVPLIERVRFLGIFSNNLDEFFRVRVATVKRMVGLYKRVQGIPGGKPKDLLNEIQRIVIRQRKLFQSTYEEILKELKEHNIYITDEKQLTNEQQQFVTQYFREEVRPALVPIMITNIRNFPYLTDKSIYFAIELSHSKKTKKKEYALIELPTDVLPRFVVVPSTGKKKHLIILDDIIRFCLHEIFAIFNYDTIRAHTIKLTRDAELDIDQDLSKSFVEKMKKSLKKRQKGQPVRFVYDMDIPDNLLKLLMKRMKLDTEDNLIPGSRYHNSKDFMSFPNIGSEKLTNKPSPPLPHKLLNPFQSILSVVKKRDFLLHYPYQSFTYFIDLLREAAIDTQVESIKISLYRVAKNSKVINALINAAKNGKKVTVILELQARFDEEANIYWSGILKEEGVRVIHGIPDMKVHSKICLITRKEDRKTVRYASIGTGNYHEGTAKLYSDLSLFTSDRRLTLEVNRVFSLFENNEVAPDFHHLIVSPHHSRERFDALIQNEIKNAKKGKKAYMILKMNSLVDNSMINKLYDASNAGVKIDLIVRGMCSLVPEMEGLSENIKVISIIDKYLEHARIFMFYNGGREKYYISSADWMTRNLDHRVEVTCPVYDRRLQREIKKMLTMQLRDNVKARIQNAAQDNVYKQTKAKGKTRAQVDFYEYLKKQL